MTDNEARFAMPLPSEAGETISRGVQGKRVLVTAGASGIGFSIASAFARDGAEVCICDISMEALAQAKASNGALTGLLCDVADPEAVRGLFEELAVRWDGAMDVLVNNAGIAGPFAGIEDIGWEDWCRTLDVNVSGMFLCVKAAIPLFRSAGAGAIINISSSSARTGLPQRLPYVVSKQAVHGLTRNVARELGPMNISCNAVLPGLNNSRRGLHHIEIQAGQEGISYERAMEENLRFVSMRQVVDVGEIAALCLHLGSPAGRHISGQFIGVCGNAEWE